MRYSFSFIIGYRHSQDRFNNLLKVLNWVSGFERVQIILVEQDTHSKVSHLNLNCKHIFVKSDKPYNRSWGFNIGLKFVKTNIVVFGDSDIIMDPSNFIDGLKKLSEFDMVSPYSSVVDLELNENLLNISDIFKIDRPGRGENDNQKINMCGGISMFRLESINKIGGWSESFIGWGGEDDFQSIKVEKLLTSHVMYNKCYHLYHAKSSPDMKYYKQSLYLLEKSKKLNNSELIDMISKMSRGNGLLNKFNDN